MILAGLQLGVAGGSSESKAQLSCATTITPACVRADASAAMANNALPPSHQGCELADLTTFVTRFRRDATCAKFAVAQVNLGGKDQTNRSPGGV